jgi:hypothetical protein
VQNRPRANVQLERPERWWASYDHADDEDLSEAAIELASEWLDELVDGDMDEKEISRACNLATQLALFAEDHIETRFLRYAAHQLPSTKCSPQEKSAWMPPRSKTSSGSRIPTVRLKRIGGGRRSASRRSRLVRGPCPRCRPEPLPGVARITVRYDVVTGQPKWDPLDFDLEGGEIDIDAKGAQADASENIITLSIEERDFELTVKGFDRRRDLLVDYNLLKTPEIADA